MLAYYSSAEFEAKYTYDGSDLGAVCTEHGTRFRLWAPTADAVTVNLYKSGTPGTPDLTAQLPMTPDVCGTWVAEAGKDLSGVYYTYLVTVNGAVTEACDPYARTTGVNGRRAMVLDPASADPEGWQEDRSPFLGRCPTDAVLYELHIRDLSMDESAGIRNRGKFLGLTETGTVTPGGSATGLDHIRRLGITHVHLLPVYDFGFTDEGLPAPQYNWGYDPENFNVPEGSYATDPFHGEVRVREMKQLVKALHDNGISVVMDVVYNHVYDGKDFCFNRIVPGYFSRVSPDGVWSNGSICGNDTASERSMVRKYIVDSVNYWADEYHIDGFRFDLVGLLDIRTVNEIVSTVRAKHPHVIFYGEGWNMPTRMTKDGCPLAVQSNSAQTSGFAFFSDTIRDLVRGDTFVHSRPGYATGALVSKAALEACFMGMPHWAAEPGQSVNYVSCHDNHTLFDRIALSVPDASVEDRARMNTLAAAFTLLSQGIPFLQAGEELLRTKPDGKGGFDENSYRSPDSVNAIQWSALDTGLCRETAAYYRGLLAFRRAHPGLRLSTRDQVLRRVQPIFCDDPQTVAFRVEEEHEEILLIFHAGAGSITLPLPEGVWDVNIHDRLAGTLPLRQAEGTVDVAPVSATVLTRRLP